jgi:hypothetical protein
VTNANSPYIVISKNNIICTDNSQPLGFISGFSNPLMSDNITGFALIGTNIYVVFIPTLIGASDWVLINLVIMYSPLIPQCNNSQAMNVFVTSVSWNITTNSQYTYLIGIQNIDTQFLYGTTYLANTTFKDQIGANFTLGVITIDNSCFQTVAQSYYYPLATLQPWQIGIIVAGCVIFLIIVGVTIFCVLKRNKLQVD